MGLVVRRCKMRDEMDLTEYLYDMKYQILINYPSPHLSATPVHQCVHQCAPEVDMVGLHFFTRVIVSDVALITSLLEIDIRYHNIK